MTVTRMATLTGLIPVTVGTFEAYLVGVGGGWERRAQDHMLHFFVRLPLWQILLLVAVTALAAVAAVVVVVVVVVLAAAAAAAVVAVAAAGDGGGDDDDDDDDDDVDDNTKHSYHSFQGFMPHPSKPESFYSTLGLAFNGLIHFGTLGPRAYKGYLLGYLGSHGLVELKVTLRTAMEMLELSATDLRVVAREFTPMMF